LTDPRKEPRVNDSYDPETLRLLDESKEIRIETRRNENTPAHRTIIWVVTLDEAVFVRSVRGEKGRWYREALANPNAVVHAGDERIPVRAVPVTDEPTVRAVSDAYQGKYGRRAPGSTRAMVRPEVLPTTLKLEPA
jgi:hypothetical protein